LRISGGWRDPSAIALPSVFSRTKIISRSGRDRRAGKWVLAAPAGSCEPLGVPLAATAAGWLLAGCEPPAIARPVLE
jgi:hypothetical protein